MRSDLDHLRAEVLGEFSRSLHEQTFELLALSFTISGLVVAATHLG